MSEPLTIALLWVLALGGGVMAGLYFAFSAFIMRAFGQIDPVAGIAAMNAINATIVRSWFMPLFLGSTLAAVVLAASAGLDWGSPGAALRLAGGAIYTLGMFVVTIACNVPMNTALAATNPTRPEGQALWTRFQRRWTFWNHVRTLASIAASALSIAALAGMS